MAGISTLLYGLIALFTLDALLEMAFISSMVSWLHINNHDIPYGIASSLTSEAFDLFPKPKILLVNQGHTSNGAAGTAVVLIGIGGLMVFWLQSKGHKLARPLYLAWFIFLVLDTLLILAALIYTFDITSTSAQLIDPTIATDANGAAYPDGHWTPENWYKQVLTLPFVNPSERNGIESHLRAMEGWRWNLVPLLVLGVLLIAVAAVHLVNLRREKHGYEKGHPREVEEDYGYQP